MRSKDTLLGYFFIAAGAVLFIAGAGNLLFRIAMAIIGIYIINFGLLITGNPSIFAIISHIMSQLLRRK